jgi:hypothetical protein
VAEVHVQATDIVKPILEDIVANQPMLDEIVIQELDLGHLPMRFAGLKVYDTKDDEVILETPVQWGSAVKVPPPKTSCGVAAGRPLLGCKDGKCMPPCRAPGRYIHVVVSVFGLRLWAATETRLCSGLGY